MTADSTAVGWDYVESAFGEIPSVDIDEYEYLDESDPEGDLHVALWIEDHRKMTIERIIVAVAERCNWLFDHVDVDLVGIKLQARYADIRVAFGIDREWFEIREAGKGTDEGLLEAIEKTTRFEGDDLERIRLDQTGYNRRI